MDFTLTGGSVLGKDHRRAGRNNQDAFGYREGPGYLAAVVTDGCGSSPHSEIGARVGVNLTLNGIALGGIGYPYPWEPIFWEHLRAYVAHGVLNLARGMDGNAVAEIIREHFLFTTVGCVITDEGSWFFSLGDGYVAINGKEYRLGPFPDNAPPYLAYNLSPEGLQLQERYHYRIIGRVPELESFALGTDGVWDLLAEGVPKEFHPAILTGDERTFRNPDHLRRRLALANRERTRLNRETGDLSITHGLLSDDTTLVLGRRMT